MIVVTCQACRKQFVCNKGSKRVTGCKATECLCPVCYIPDGRWKEYVCWEGIENPYSLYTEECIKEVKFSMIATLEEEI